jgi:superfamily II RNA helicase
MWAKGASVKTTLEYLYNLEEYEGNFVKNMLKVCNIINDIQCVCKMIGKVELLQILENTETLILRDIVTVTSLYLK